jgi:hypothetical protein
LACSQLNFSIFRLRLHPAHKYKIMGRSIIAILAGIILAMVTITVVQMLGHQIYESPAGLDLNDKAAIAAYMEKMPIGAMLMVLLAYMAGAFLGGLLAARLAPRKPILHAMIIGGVLLIAGIANFIMLPHPVWFFIVSVISYFLFAYLGGLVGRKLGGKGSGVLMG